MVAPPAVLAGEVVVGVTSLAVAGAASPADPAGVLAVDVNFLGRCRDGHRRCGLLGRCWDGVPSRHYWGCHRRCGAPGRCRDGHRR